MQRALLFITLCAASLWAGKKAPDWVASPPQSKSEYTGVGLVEKRHYASKDAWESAAKMQALKNLSAAISIQIMSNVEMVSHESTEKLSRSFSEDIGSFTTANLMGYTLGDVWETRTTYAIYFRLNKERWHTLEQERLREKTSEALQYLSQGDRGQTNHQPLEAVQGYIAAVRALQSVLYLNPEVEQEGIMVPFIALLRDRFTSVLQEITIAVATPLFEGPREVYAQQPTPIRVTYQGKALPHFPLSVGKQVYETDQQGEATLPPEILGEALHHPLTITTAWRQLLTPQDGEKSLLVLWLNQQLWPRAATAIRFDQSTIAVTSSERNLGIPRPGEDLALTTKSHLYRQGFHIAQEGKQARYTFTITADSRYIYYAKTMHFVELTVRWTVADPRGEIIYSQTLEPLMAGAINGPQAGEKAYHAAQRTVADAISAWLSDHP